MIPMAPQQDGTPSESPQANEPSASQRWLWTPWRMKYVGGAKKEPGCVFCRNLDAADDRESLILHRDQTACVIMNLYPYNTGHTMIVPRDHCSSPELASPESILALASLQAPLLRATRRALRCEGFNLGMNVGAVAGAGITEHLHEHVVPRWVGDANFMPVLSNTKVLPEMIPVTYAKLRAELTRELHDSAEVLCAVFNHDHQVLVDRSGHVPQSLIKGDDAVWMIAALAVKEICGTSVDLTGWAGAGQAGGPLIQLEFQVAPGDEASLSLANGWQWVPLSELGVTGPQSAWPR